MKAKLSYLSILQSRFRQEVGEDFAIASDHPYTCRCAKCWHWWKTIGPDEEGWGPFTQEEMQADEPPKGM